MQKQLEVNSLDGEFVEHYDRDTIEEKDLEIFTPYMKEYSRRPFIATFLSHLSCYTQDFDVALVLEDDAILCQNFSNILDNYMSQLPSDWDMLFIGDACDFHIPVTTPDRNVYFKSREQTSWGGHGATRSASSYVVTKKCAERIADYAKKGHVFHMIDHWLNHVIRELNLNVYWAEPTIVKPGSEIGMFQRSLNVNFR
jgi:GR25 family glycosyltransferase involved in LPS biosynthesis